MSPPPRSALFPYTTLFRSFTGVADNGGFTTVGGAAAAAGLASGGGCSGKAGMSVRAGARGGGGEAGPHRHPRSEEHTSELQSLRHLVCRLLLEKKKNEGGE